MQAFLQDIKRHVDSEKTRHRTETEALQFWQTIWHRPCMPEELSRLRNGNLTAPAGPPMANKGTWSQQYTDPVASHMYSHV